MASDRSTRGASRTFDHSPFPDEVQLKTREEIFTVSASYLSLHSSHFQNLFYGSERALEKNQTFQLDVDSHTFGDLLDIIYPSFKRTNCCPDCSSSLSDRLRLALQLKIRTAVKRILQENPIDREVIEILVEYDAWHLYKMFIPWNIVAMAEDKYSKLIQKSDIYRIIMPEFLFTGVPASFPDRVSVNIRGKINLVSASTLSLHSPFLHDKFYTSDGLVKSIDLDINQESFATFVTATAGHFANDFSSQFLSDLSTLGANGMLDYCISIMERSLPRLPRHKKIEVHEKLLRHYKQQETEEISQEKSKEDSESPASCAELELEEDSEDRAMIIVIKTLAALSEENASTEPRSIPAQFRILPDPRIPDASSLNRFSLPCKTSDTVEGVKRRIERIQQTPVDHQRLIFNGKQLENERTLGEVDVKNGDAIVLEKEEPESPASCSEMEREDESEDGAMIVVIKTLVGLAEENASTEPRPITAESVNRFSLPCKTSDTVESVKRTIEQFRQIPVDQQRLIFLGKQLENEKTLGDSNVKSGDALILVLRLC